jgi:putative addiction module component (TIGR02574 family)
MSKNAQEVLKDALELPEQERTELVCDLLDSLDSGPPGSKRSEEEWISEIERRARAVLAGEPGIPWEEVRAELDKRLTRG